MAKKKLKTKARRAFAVRSASATIPRKVRTKKAAKKRVKKKPSKKRSTRKLTSRRGLRDLGRRAAVANAKKRARALALIADIRRRKKRIADDFHAIGRALSELNDVLMYRVAGYETFEGLLAGEKLMSKTLAYKLIAIVDAYPAAIARELGIEKAYALFRYTESTPANELARNLAEGNPRIGNQRLRTMSVRDLREAAKRVRARRGAGRAASEPERDARRVARRVQKELRAKGAKSAKARAKRLGGEWRVQIELGVDEVGVLG